MNVKFEVERHSREAGVHNEKKDEVRKEWAGNSIQCVMAGEHAAEERNEGGR